MVQTGMVWYTNSPPAAHIAQFNNWTWDIHTNRPSNIQLAVNTWHTYLEQAGTELCQAQVIEIEIDFDLTYS